MFIQESVRESCKLVVSVASVAATTFSSHHMPRSRKARRKRDHCTHILCIKCFGNAHADCSAGLKLKCSSASYFEQFSQPRRSRSKTTKLRLSTEHAVSTTFSFVKDEYKLIELRVEYKALRDNWDKNQSVENFKKRKS